MAFSEALAERIRQGLARLKGIEEKKMFGGVGFLLNGNLLLGVRKDSLLVRLDPEQSDEALQEAHVSEFEITGRRSNHTGLRLSTATEVGNGRVVPEDHPPAAYLRCGESEGVLRRLPRLRRRLGTPLRGQHA